VLVVLSVTLVVVVGKVVANMKGGPDHEGVVGDGGGGDAAPTWTEIAQPPSPSSHRDYMDSTSI
jgi:hypothetical protein